MSSWTGYFDKVAKYFQSVVEPAPKPSAGVDVLKWAKKVFTVTWVDQPQNVYNLIAFACALIVIYVGIKYGKDQIK